MVLIHLRVSVPFGSHGRNQIDGNNMLLIARYLVSSSSNLELQLQALMTDELEYYDHKCGITKQNTKVQRSIEIPF